MSERDVVMLSVAALSGVTAYLITLRWWTPPISAISGLVVGAAVWFIWA